MLPKFRKRSTTQMVRTRALHDLPAGCENHLEITPGPGGIVHWQPSTNALGVGEFEIVTTDTYTPIARQTDIGPRASDSGRSPDLPERETQIREE